MADDNPYEPPRLAADATRKPIPFRMPRSLFVAANVSCGVLFLVPCMIWILIPRDPSSFFGSLILGVPLMLFIFLECRTLYRQSRVNEFLLAIMLFVLAAFTAVVIRSDPNDSNLDVATVVGAIMIVYLSLAGVVRFWRAIGG